MPKGYSIYAFLLMLIVGLSVWSSSSKAADWEMGIGRTVFQPSDNGIWWQNGLDHHLETESNSIQLGRTGKFDSGLRWRASYIYLGQVNTWGIATTDADFSGYGCISNPCAARDTFIGRGYVDGFQFSLAPEWQFGKTKLFVEGGAFIFQAHFNIVVTGDQWHTRPQNEMWVNRNREADWDLRAMFGVGVEYDDWQLVASGYGVDGGHEDVDSIPNYHGYAYNLTLRKRFK